MTLSKLLDGIKVTKMFQTMFGKMILTHEVEVRGIQYDSRKVGRDDLFVAIRGGGADGHRFIDDAVSRGATVVVVEDDEIRPDTYFMHAGVVKVVVADSRRTLACLAANYFDHPSEKLTLIGVTGTNGKTTTTHLIASFLQGAGLIGTIEHRIGPETIRATHTTPESLELNGLLARMVGSGCTAAVMEVSSHALHQHRVDGLEFDTAVFTNLTQDHLDYHGSMEEYFKAKKTLFDGLSATATAVTNADDHYGMRMVEDCRAAKMTYGFALEADVRAENLNLDMSGTRCAIVHRNETTAIESPLIGRFNVSNILAAFAAGIAAGVPKAALKKRIAEFRDVRGRFERIQSTRAWTVIIDYAHTPDALEHCLRAIRDIFGGQPSAKRGRIITVFGCGGNRDRGKRPMMGRIATELSDITIITSDNPRFEDPETIIDEVLKGVREGAAVHRQVDREKAIGQALSMARHGDVVLIAGKGHETYQVIGDTKIHFSDHEVVQEMIRSLR